MIADRGFDPGDRNGWACVDGSVGQRRRFLHDGRAKSLDEVVGDLRHQLDKPITAAEVADLLAFLRSV